MNSLPYQKVTFKGRFEETQEQEPKTNRFLKNRYFQKYLELLFPVHEICFGMLSEDSAETRYYKVDDF